MEIKKGKISIFLSLIVAFAFIGIVNSAILLDIHNNEVLNKQTRFCVEDSGCDIFEKSAFSKVFEIPISVIMLGFYMIFIVIIMLKKFWPKYYKTKLIIFSIIGIIISCIMFYITQIELKEYCNYCTYFIIINISISVFVALYCKKEIKKITN